MSLIRTRPIIRLLRLNNYPVLDQLVLEEALFRCHREHWFVLNDGVAEPSVVVGISGKVHELIDVERAAAANVSIIRRFTGGGTVIVDGNSILTSLIVDGPEAVPEVPPYPRPIMAWTEQLFQVVFQKHCPDFSLRENDYAFGQSKFGGNAQAISKSRWLHHTSFLWDYSPGRMQVLLQPPKMPAYRQGRDHRDFLTKLCDFIPSREALVDDLCGCLESSPAGFRILPGSLEEGLDAVAKNTLVGSKKIPLVLETQVERLA